jgi:hypothetical protein
MIEEQNMQMELHFAGTILEHKIKVDGTKLKMKKIKRLLQRTKVVLILIKCST